MRPHFSHGFPMVFPMFSHGFPGISQLSGGPKAPPTRSRSELYACEMRRLRERGAPRGPESFALGAWTMVPWVHNGFIVVFMVDNGG